MIHPVLQTTGAAALSTSSILASLIHHLRLKGALSDREITEIYEFALLMLEHEQGDDDGGVMVIAREMIEDQLRPKNEVTEGK